MLLDFQGPQTTDCAVAMVCDAGYLPYALHLAYQVILTHPARDFDILIASTQTLDLPPWAQQAGVRELLLPWDARLDGLPSGGRLPRETYLKLLLPDTLAGRYRRLLYLDCDIFLDSTGLDRLLRLPMGDHPLAAVQDVDPLLKPGFHAGEFRALGLPALPYFNAGVLLIDTAAWQRDDVMQRGCQISAQTPAVMRLCDQSFLNGTLQGRYAELSPVWNWMCNRHFPLLTMGYPARLRHFIGRTKPWADPNGLHDGRFAGSYAAFFAKGQPAGVVNRPETRSIMSTRAMAQHVMDLYKSRKRLVAELERFRDDWDVKLTPGAGR